MCVCVCVCVGGGVVLQHVTWGSLQMHLLHLVQVVEHLFFSPQHIPLLLVELLAAVALALSG